MKLETATRLHDAATACQELREFSEGRTREQFLTDRGLQLVVWKLIEIVGEALKQAEPTDPTLEQKVPDFRDIVNTRNRITHGYDGVDFNLLWDIVQSEIPSLQTTLVALLGDAPQIDTPHQG